MAQTAKPGATSGDQEVEVLRAVRALPSAELKNIIRAHYGHKRVHAQWQRVLHSQRDVARCNNNLRLYLGLTNDLGRMEGAAGDIVAAYNAMGSVSEDERDETSVSWKTRGEQQQRREQQQEPVAEPERDNSETGTDEGVRESDTYLEAFECNTTRSCCLEIGAVGCYDSEDDSDEDDRFEQRPGSELGSRAIARVDDASIEGDDEAMRRGILEDEIVEKPKVVIVEDD